jgi:hypothetical protein
MRTVHSSRLTLLPAAAVVTSFLLIACAPNWNDVGVAPADAGAAGPRTNPEVDSGASASQGDPTPPTLDAMSGLLSPTLDASMRVGDSGPVAANLIDNWSFESAAVGTGGWMGWQSTIGRVANANAPNGHYVALVAEATEVAGDGYSIQDDPNTVSSATAGVSYSATAYVASASPTSVGKSVALVLREQDAAGNIVQLSPASVSLTTAFQKLVTSATVQNSGDSLDIYIYQDGSEPGDAFFTDAITFVPTGGAGAPAMVDAGMDSGSSGSQASLDSGAAPPPASGTSPSGEAPPAADAYPGYTLALEDDFPGSSLSSAWNGFYGGPNANGGAGFNSSLGSVSGGVVTMLSTAATGYQGTGMETLASWTAGHALVRARISLGCRHHLASM